MNSLGFNKKTKNTRVVVAMSGGVDSSVAAVMLKKEGYDVLGITMNLYSQKDVKSSKSCCAGKDIEDAKKVAKQYNFPHITLDYQENFFNGVINNFIDSYAEGETPVPCIQCNQTVKFRDLLEEAKKMKADTLVTGHYVRRLGNHSNVKLFKAKDPSKDQSYFLFATLKDQLDYVRFPLGDFLKSEIREMAENYKLSISDKPDSQDICFVTSNTYRDFLNNIKPDLNISGDIIDLNGKILGTHKGIANYTIGQRKGVGIGGFDLPLYVIDINKKKNQIILGESKFLKKTTISLKNINWLDDSILINNLKCAAKIRSTQKESSGILKIRSNNAEFTFDEEINNTSPGQACVFYLQDQVLGGGWITKKNN
ncbi:tRNA 2-thiouridine(34) synthase MnmA [Alphaproteobacteria bacterium]|nr:tRNA 2-thiouridine(34) synthase MnmA [Alphaproteobacteria bacterium]